MKIFEQVKGGITANLTDAKLVSGETILCRRYYEDSEPSNIMYLVQTPAEFVEVPDEFGDHTLANGNIAVLVENNEDLDCMNYGHRTNDDTFDALPMLQAMGLKARSTTTSLKYNIILPRGRIYISDELELEREVSYIGKGAKVTTFNPIPSLWDNSTEKYVVRDAVLELDEVSGEGRPDNNFFGIRRDFGTRNDDDITNLGCFWAICGGGSEYRNLFLADANGSDTMRVQGIPVSTGGDGGAAVGATFYGIWLATTREGTISRARNGLRCDNAFSCSFYGLIVDYQSNLTDYLLPDEDEDGFGIKLDNCQVNFYSTNMEGNHKPVYCNNAQHSAFYGASIYRKGLGQQTPSSDEEFIVRCTSRNSMASMHNIYASLGYGAQYGGGVGATLNAAGVTPYAIVTSGDLATTSGGGFSYLNNNPVNFQKLGNTNTISTPLELEVGSSSLFLSPVHRLFRALIRTVYDETVAAGSGNIDIPLNAYGKLVITATRSDSSNSNRGDIVHALYGAERQGALYEGNVLITDQLLDNTSSTTFITGVSVIDNGTDAVLRISYSSTTYPFRLTVLFEGKTKDDVEEL